MFEVKILNFFIITPISNGFCQISFLFFFKEYLILNALTLPPEIHNSYNLMINFLSRRSESIYLDFRKKIFTVHILKLDSLWKKVPQIYDRKFLRMIIASCKNSCADQDNSPGLGGGVPVKNCVYQWLVWGLFYVWSKDRLKFSIRRGVWFRPTSPPTLPLPRIFTYYIISSSTYHLEGFGICPYPQWRRPELWFLNLDFEHGASSGRMAHSLPVENVSDD